MRQLIDAARQRGNGAANALHDSYWRLVGLTTQLVRQAQRVETALGAETEARAHRLQAVLQIFILRVR